MIVSFSDQATADLYHAVPSGRVLRFPVGIVRTARRKLDLLAAATCLDDLRVPPGNRLQLLQGDWAGRYSIRVNDQWRLTFLWTEDGPAGVRLMDYH